MDINMDIDFIGKLAIGSFIAIVFLQSGLDKIFDWKGNHAWITDHFKNSFLARLVTPTLGVITILETAAGVISLVGLFCLLWMNDGSCIFYSVLVSLLALLMLLFGQRVAKDYEGAKTIAIYFGVIMLSLLFF